MSNCCLVVAAATSTMYIIMAALRILMAFGLGKIQDDPQLPPMTFDGNIWLTFANIFWFWQHFLVSLVHTSCRFFVFQVHGQDIENLIVVFTLLLKQQCKYIYIGTSILKHTVKGKVDSSVASTYSYTTTAICACGVRGKVGGDLDSSEFSLQNVNDLQLRSSLLLSEWRDFRRSGNFEKQNYISPLLSFSNLKIYYVL